MAWKKAHRRPRTLSILSTLCGGSTGTTLLSGVLHCSVPHWQHVSHSLEGYRIVWSHHYRWEPHYLRGQHIVHALHCSVVQLSVSLSFLVAAQTHFVDVLSLKTLHVMMLPSVMLSLFRIKFVFGFTDRFVVQRASLDCVFFATQSVGFFQLSRALSNFSKIKNNYTF